MKRSLIAIPRRLQRRVWNKLNLTSKRCCQVSLVLFLSCLTVRLLPYLAPISAEDLVQDDRAITFHDRNGLLLGTLLTRDQDHTAVVPLEQMSPQFLQGILAAEDGRFYQHGALEMRAVARAIQQAIEAREIVSGASTVTMQLARMLEPAPRTLPAKIQEVWLSWRLAAGMSKDEILAAYINRLPMGGNIYGVEAASRIYFGTPAAELNLAQASLLAAIPNNPNYLNPYDYWQYLKRRQKYVLRRMVEDGYISQSQANRAFAEAVSLHPRQQGILAAPHFLFWVAKQLPSEHPPQINTTLDRPLQQFVATQVQQVVSNLATRNVRHAAALVLDNKTGEVLAYVGSPDYFTSFQEGKNDGVQALRQPGSTLKPFLYHLALSQGKIRPNTILADIPTHYGIPGARLYSPTDYSETFQGPVRVRIALANSLNVPAVRVLEQVGVANFLNYLHQLGFRNLQETPEHYGLGLALGSGEVSLWELARAYLTLARAGNAREPIFTLSPTGGRGQEAEGRRQSAEGSRQKAEGKSPNTQIPNSTSSLITNMLSDPHARASSFGVDSVLNLPFPAAVKTGTSSNYRDTWTVGFTSDYTVATWVGNFDGTPMRQVSGVRGAAPLWHRIMLHLHENKEPAAFPPPVDLVSKPICALSGKKPSPACPTIVQEYFYPGDLAEYENNPDTFYQTTASVSQEYSLNLPDEYDEWLSVQPASPANSSTVKILSPRSGDRFLLFPNTSETADSSQKLEFKLNGASNEVVEWWLNGKKLATNSNDSWFWQLSPGQWELEVKSGSMSDRVTFQVELASDQQPKQGFSFVDIKGVINK